MDDQQTEQVYFVWVVKEQFRLDCFCGTYLMKKELATTSGKQALSYGCDVIKNHSVISPCMKSHKV